MAFTYDFQGKGIEIKHEEKDQLVFVNTKALEVLRTLQSKIEECVQQKKEGEWKLDEEKDLRAHINTYKDNWYLHIRHWFKERPTKKGVSLHLPQDWDTMKKHLQKETLLGIKVMTSLVKENVGRLLQEECDGCLNDWPSQIDHDCLQNSMDKAELVIDKAVTEITALHFIASLAEEACDEKLILEMPHQTMKHVLKHHIKDIKAHVVTHYDY